LAVGTLIKLLNFLKEQVPPPKQPTPKREKMKAYLKRGVFTYAIINMKPEKGEGVVGIKLRPLQGKPKKTNL